MLPFQATAFSGRWANRQFAQTIPHTAFAHYETKYLLALAFPKAHLSPAIPLPKKHATIHREYL
jgi:hypothetical protein